MLFEIIMIIAAVTAMAKIADAEDRSTLLWGGMTLALCIASLFVVPLPMVRIFLVFVFAFIMMIVAKIVGGR